MSISPIAIGSSVFVPTYTDDRGLTSFKNINLSPEIKFDRNGKLIFPNQSHKDCYYSKYSLDDLKKLNCMA